MMQPNRNAQMAMGLLQGLGWSPVQAAGIVGNLMQESSVNPVTRPGDNGTAHGIAQWRGSRWTNMLNFAQRTGGDPSSLATQIRFLDHELRTQYPTAARAVAAARTPEEAAGAFGLHYERPRGAETGIARNIDGYSNRVNVARAMMGMGPGNFDMAEAERGHGGMGYGPQQGGYQPGVPDIQVAGRDRTYGGDVNIEGPGDLSIGGGGGGGGGGGAPTGGGSETDLSDLRSGGASIPSEAFAQDTSGIDTIQQRLASKAQLARMGMGDAVGEISPIGKVFDASVMGNIGQAANMPAMRKIS